MKTYIGVKIIQAEPATYGEFHARQGRPVTTMNSDQPGYHVLYPDGYQSWSPREVFEGAYRLVSDDERALVFREKRKETFFDRLLAESKELDGRLEKLAGFIDKPAFFDLPRTQQDLLHDQYVAMTEYSLILGRRIAALASETSTGASRQAMEEIDEGVRMTGGGRSEEPLSFRD